MDPGLDTPKADSVLTLKLEGALGGFMSVSESGSREDTLSPLVSQKLGELHSLFGTKLEKYFLLLRSFSN